MLHVAFSFLSLSLSLSLFLPLPRPSLPTALPSESNGLDCAHSLFLIKSTGMLFRETSLHIGTPRVDAVSSI